MITGQTIELPSGQKIWVDTLTLSNMPRIGKLVTKDYYDKGMKGIESSFLHHAKVDDNISKKQVDIYYIKGKRK